MSTSISLGNDMVPMRMSTQKSIEMEMQPAVSHIVKHKRSNGVIVIIVSVVFITFFLLTMSSKNAPSSHTILSNVNSRPVNLRYMVRSATERAQQHQKLVPVIKSSPELIEDHGVEFLLSYMIEPELKSRVMSDDDAADNDPFDANHLDPYLFVSTIPPLHSLVLNKFTSIKDHAILITNRFRYQNTLLTYDDIETWYWCVSKIDAVGFYNSDPVAGSSQPHKHMQLVPMDELREMYSTASSAAPLLAGTEPYSGKASLPIEKLIFPHIETGEWSLYDPLGGQEEVHSIREFHFKHAVLVLMDETEWASTRAAHTHSFNEYLFTAYTRLLAAVMSAQRRNLLRQDGEVAPLPYNLMLTTRWMLIVPRSAENFRELANVNGLGFLGLLMARNESAFQYVKSTTGPLAVLEGVSVV